MKILQNDGMPAALGATLKHLRTKKGWSQEEFAATAGVDRRYMSDIELGKRNVSLDVLCKIASALSLKVSDLLALTERSAMAMSTINNFKEWLCEAGYEDAVVFENPDYLSAIIGVSDDGRVIYSYPLMVTYLADTDGLTADEAAEFIDYNTVRSIPYIGNKAPIICYDII